ncbi:MAG: phenylalanine--tRNA ligase subunit beta [Ignavibacteria bacterium]|nr:phenylalanine--tRNA ligase subunit beta [Ignavibacteria bacterium]
MKISLNWLKDYVDLTGISVEEIVEKISIAGLEVEEVIDQSASYKNMVVGFVKEAKKHPNADKLSVCIVNDGTSDYNVVCGAPNVATGQKIAFAKVGAVIPSNGLKLEKVKIRGEVSMGMICSEMELGISDNHEGILVLNDELKVGIPLADALGMNDVVIDVSVTPNRADALSHIGFARDIAAIFKRKFSYPEISFSETGKKSEDVAEVEIVDSKNCPRYVGKIVEGVTIKESPDWLKRRLKSIGLRPINNVVDVTNYVLYEVGQPLHAFDLDNLAERKIVVQCASEGEKFTTLDSKERALTTTDLMICDANKKVAIAGVMGGENSEVTSSTKNILIESAFFNPSSVRKTAKRLGLSTDASFRFERGTDYNIVVWAARRAAQLIEQLAGGEILSGEIDAYPQIIPVKSTSVRFDRITKILGYSITVEEVKSILTSLGFVIKSSDKHELKVEIPSYRHDVEREIDIIEEVARVYGYEKIPDINSISVTLEPKIDQASFNDKVRNTFTSMGFFEIITNSLLNEEIAEKFGKPIKMLNPQSSEMSHLRPSLLPGMLQSISNNLKVSEKNLKFFEIGKTFEKKNEGDIQSFDDFSETDCLIIGISGNSIQTEWFDKDKPYDFYDLKGIVESFVSKLYADIEYNLNECENSNYNLCFTMSLLKNEIGIGGKVNGDLLKLFDINQDVYSFIINLDKLREIRSSEKVFTDLLKFPKVYRDVAFILDKTIKSDKVIEIIKQAGSNLLHQIKLFDIFQSDSLGEGKKSLAFQLEFYNKERTLTESEIEKDFRNIIKAVEKNFNAQLRGN